MTQPVRHHQPSGSVDERITHAALTLIAEHGLGGVTMTDVATTWRTRRSILAGALSLVAMRALSWAMLVRLWLSRAATTMASRSG